MKHNLPQLTLSTIKPKYHDIAKSTFNSLHHQAMMSVNPMSTTYMADKWNNTKQFNKFLYTLSSLDILSVSTIPGSNWSEMKLTDDYLESIFGSKEQLISARTMYKREYYMLSSSTKLAEFDNVKTPTGIKKTGLHRPGFAMAGLTLFGFDIPMLSKYYDIISEQMKLSIEDTRKLHDGFKDEVDFAIIIDEVLKYHLNVDSTWNTGESLIDGRGRAISTSLSKIMNPISNKWARALITVTPERLTSEGVKAVYLFIAELLGIKSKNPFSKALSGKRAYESKTPLKKSDSHFYDVIWLERLYNALDNHFNDDTYKFNVYIECDATASIAQCAGALLGDYDCLSQTNCIYDPETSPLEDFWETPLPTREHAKKFLTPKLYGSQQDIKTLWTKNKLKFTAEDLNMAEKLASTGYFHVLDTFKNFVISNCKPQEYMNVCIWNEEFTVECNRFRNIGDYKTSYKLYDTESDLIQKIEHTTTKKVPDLKQFRLYFQTLLV
jgi:hypothetical protein